MKKALLVFFLVSLVWPAYAQEINFYFGEIRHTETNDDSYTWALEYLDELGENTAFSVSWLNEGHLPNHHRDGQSIQFWGRTRPFDERFSLSAGIGPYLFYDTTPRSIGLSKATRGLAVIFSLGATWRMDDSWLIQLRSNLVKTGSTFDTYSLALGIGYQLDSPPSSVLAIKEPAQIAKTTTNEVTFFVGRTNVNDFNTPSTVCLAAEYRRGLSRHVDMTIGWLSEGKDQRVYRTGPLAQLWAVRSFYKERLALGAGAGFHVDVSSNDPTTELDDKSTFAGAVSFTASYRFQSPWLTRISWNRIVTHYDRDTDAIIGGLGYRF